VDDGFQNERFVSNPTPSLHFSYHIYAAAVVAHFDESWAMENFENILLLVRDYANPEEQDNSFPIFRNKDFYRGHSWANGKFTLQPVVETTSIMRCTDFVRLTGCTHDFAL
jgi:hypothetical protein